MHSRQACCSTNSHTIYKCYMIPGRITTSASPPAGQCTAGMHAAYPPSPVLSRTLHTHQRLYSVCTMHTHQRLHSPTPALSMHDAYTPAPVLTDACTQYAMHTHQRLYSPTPALSMHDAYSPTPVLTNACIQYSRCILTNACTHQRQHSVCTMHTHNRLYSPTPALSMHDAYTTTPVLTNACTHQRLYARAYSPTPVLTNACTQYAKCILTNASTSARHATGGTKCEAKHPKKNPDCTAPAAPPPVGPHSDGRRAASTQTASSLHELGSQTPHPCALPP